MYQVRALFLDGIWQDFASEKDYGARKPSRLHTKIYLWFHADLQEWREV